MTTVPTIAAGAQAEGKSVLDAAKQGGTLINARKARAATKQLQEDRFGFEPEVTAKVARLQARIYEVGISYAGRTYEEGKKIGWRDGVRAIYAIFKYNIFKRS
jgi:hypothetical protein